MHKSSKHVNKKRLQKRKCTNRTNFGWCRHKWATKWFCLCKYTVSDVSVSGFYLLKLLFSVAQMSWSRSMSTEFICIYLKHYVYFCHRPRIELRRALKLTDWVSEWVRAGQSPALMSHIIRQQQLLFLRTRQTANYFSLRRAWQVIVMEGRKRSKKRKRGRERGKRKERITKYLF